MYEWESLTGEERRKKLKERMIRGFPAHELPHFADGQTGCFFFTAANYRHAEIIGKNEFRLNQFTRTIKTNITCIGFDILAYCVLGNHYHFLVEGSGPERLRKELGRLHGRTSFSWNKEDGTRGRKVWFRVHDRPIRSNRDYYTKMNYIHYNPVKHEYCSKLSDWRWSSFEQWLNSIGREKMIELWRNYPPQDK